MSNMFKWVGLGLAVIGGLGGLVAAFNNALFWAVAGGIVCIIGFYAMSK